MKRFKNSTKLMWGFWVTISLSLILELHFPSLPNNLLYRCISTIFFTFFVLLWVLEDARDINVDLSKGFQWGVILLSVIFVPFYLIKYKGLKKASISFLKALGF